ncbi:hypothetical protein FGO68_gene6276 [Halteria grandinella]|uniref:Uncharacterized protein n=1 Tax=Halteria grandinella TaxID=5974 RepID=A0A8J8P356_HALGN|nr:hypothetical protein FGO68_gene6276 [Halteria grandinella]
MARLLIYDRSAAHTSLISWLLLQEGGILNGGILLGLLQRGVNLALLPGCDREGPQLLPLDWRTYQIIVYLELSNLVLSLFFTI